MGGHNGGKKQDAEVALGLIEMICDANYRLGEWSATEKLSEKFAKLSGEAFASMNDQRAQALREISMMLEKEAKSLRMDYDQIHKPNKDVAYKELEALLHIT